MNRTGRLVVVAAPAGAALLIALAVLVQSDDAVPTDTDRHNGRGEAAAPEATSRGDANGDAELVSRTGNPPAARVPRSRVGAQASDAAPAPDAPPGGSEEASDGPRVKSIIFGKPPHPPVSADEARRAAERYADAVRAGDDGEAWLPIALAGPRNQTETWAPVVDVIRDARVAAATRAAALDALIDVSLDVGRAAEDVLAASQDPRLRAAALRTILSWAQRDTPVPPPVQSILDDTSASAQERDLALSIAAVHDHRIALPMLERLVASDDPAERSRGISVLLGLRRRVYLPLMLRAQQLDIGDRLGALTQRIAEIKGSRWGAVQLTGEPDTPAGIDRGTAWSARGAQMGHVTVTAQFPHAVTPKWIRVRETRCPGSIVSVAVRVGANPDTWEVLWEGTADAGDAPRWFEPPLRAIGVATDSVRLVLDTDRFLGWEQIDAVELAGGGMQQWAIEASASSEYQP